MKGLLASIPISVITRVIRMELFVENQWSIFKHYVECKNSGL